MTGHCTFCHEPTLWIYRDTRNKDNDTNLLYCCKHCATVKDSNGKTKEHLHLSSILKPYRD